MSCGGNNGWLLDYGLVEEEIQGSEFIYMVDDPPVSSVILGFDAPRRDDGAQDNSGAKKRSRPESSAPPGTKACREKLRRDRLNERFNELCAVLEPGKPPKADKVAILSDAARLLEQLRAEAEKGSSGILWFGVTAVREVGAARREDEAEGGEGEAGANAQGRQRCCGRSNAVRPAPCCHGATTLPPGGSVCAGRQVRPCLRRRLPSAGRVLAVDTADIAGHVQGFSALAAGCVINSITYGVNHQDACAELALGVEV
ncbi:hypothetical protein ACQ4PT_052269 [Festuca glaucescens]